MDFKCTDYKGPKKYYISISINNYGLSLLDLSISGIRFINEYIFSEIFHNFNSLLSMDVNF